MKPASRKGWTRLGVVLSVSWLLGVLAYAAIDYHLLNSTESGWETTGRSERGSPAKVMKMTFLTQCGYEDKQIYTTCSPRYRNLATVVFGPIVVGWILVIAIVYAVHWVRAGFRDKES